MKAMLCSAAVFLKRSTNSLPPRSCHSSCVACCRRRVLSGMGWVREKASSRYVGAAVSTGAATRAVEKPGILSFSSRRRAHTWLRQVLSKKELRHFFSGSVPTQLTCTRPNWGISARESAAKLIAASCKHPSYGTKSMMHAACWAVSPTLRNRLCSTWQAKLGWAARVSGHAAASHEHSSHDAQTPEIFQYMADSLTPTEARP